MPLKNEIIPCDEYHQLHSLVMLYYGDKYKKMKVLEKNFFFYPPTSEILNPEKKIVEIEFFLFLFLFCFVFVFLSSDIRFR